MEQPGPLPIQSLRVAFHQSRNCGLLGYLRLTLFPRVNPFRVEYAVARGADQPAWIPFCGAPLIAEWTRTEVLEFSGSFVVFLASYTHSLAGLPPRSLPRRVLRLHLATLCFEAEGADKFLESLDILREPPSPINQFETVVLVVRSEQERREVEAAVEQVEERFRSIFLVELEI